MGLDDFERSFLGKRAWAKPGAARREPRLLRWYTLDRVLGSRPAPDVLVVARGELLPVPAPHSLLELRQLMARGIGVCVRHAERHDPKLGQVTRALADCLGRDVQLQLFVTPAQCYGFSWHYDAEDVFIVQTAGIKDYYFRENTVDARTPAATAPDFSRYRSETSPLQTAKLVAGDCLYIPSRWWHMAQCQEDSLSLSFGVSEAVACAPEDRSRPLATSRPQGLEPTRSSRSCTNATAFASTSRSVLRSK